MFFINRLTFNEREEPMSMRIRKLLPAFIMAAALTLTIPVSVYAAEDDNRDPQIREKGHRDNACQCDSHHIEERQELSAETGSHTFKQHWEKDIYFRQYICQMQSYSKIKNKVDGGFNPPSTYIFYI